MSDEKDSQDGIYYDKLETRSTTDLYHDSEKHKIPFYDTAQFSFCKLLEENTDVILKELSVLTNTDFIAWPESICESGWEVFGIYAFGRKLTENAQKCPETTKLIESIPGVTTAGFSLMAPGTHITPHKGYEGYSEHVLRLHLGLVCPDGCFIRVGREVKTWKKGQVLIFDDFMTHEAWNDGKSTRIILLLDFKYNKYGMDPDVYGADFTQGLSGLLQSIDQGKMK